MSPAEGSEEKSGFLSKLKKPFKSHSRSSSNVEPESPRSTKSSSSKSTTSNAHENIHELAYAEGQRRAEQEHKRRNENALYGNSNEVDGYGATSSKGRVISASSMGKLVTRPPKVNRQPVEKDPGGDFANEKLPTEVAAGENDHSKDLYAGTTDDGKNNAQGMAENHNPAYANDAIATQGTGVFFNPKDTQGGVYGSDYDGKHTEATRAEVARDRNLKTVPTAYQKQQEEEKKLEDVKKQAYDAGKAEGSKESPKSSSTSKSQDKDTKPLSAEGKHEDPSEIHQQNKSAYNDGGVTAVADRFHQKQKTTGGTTGVASGGAAAAAAAASGSHHNKSAEAASSSNKDIGGTTGINKQATSGVTASSSSPSYATKGANKGETNVIADAAAAGAGAGAADLGVKGTGKSSAAGSGASKHEVSPSAFGTTTPLGNSSGTGTKSANAPALNAGVPPSSKDFDYDREIQELDKKINETQNQINQLHGKAPNTTGAADDASTAALYHEPIDTLTGKNNSGYLAAGAGAAAGAAAAVAGYVGLGKKPPSDGTLETNDAYNEGVSNASYDSGAVAAKNGENYAAEPKDKNATANTNSGFSGAVGSFANNTMGLDSKETFDDYEVVNKSDATEKPSDLETNNKSTQGADKPGLLDGAAGAAAAVGAAAAGALGIDALKSSEADSESTKGTYQDSPELTKDSAYTKKADANLPADNISKSTGNSSADSTTSSGGLINSAKMAVASVGAATAGAFGYEGYTAATSGPEYDKMVVNDAYEAGKEKAHNEKSILAEAEAAGREKATKENKDKELKTGNQRSVQSPNLEELPDSEEESNSSGILGSVLGSAAAAVGYGGYKKSQADDSSKDGSSKGPDYEKSPEKDISDEGKEATTKNPVKDTSVKGPEYTDSEKDTVPTHDLAKQDPGQSSSSSKGYLATAGAVLGAAAGAVGYSSDKGPGKNTHDKSLLQEAEEQFDDVKEAPKHKTTKTVDDVDNDNSGAVGGVQEVPGLVPSTASEDDSKNKSSTTSAPSTTESDVAAYNKKHGHVNDKRNLIEIAADNDPKLKEVDHHKSAPGTKVGEDDGGQGKSDDVQAVPLSTMQNQNEFIRTGGKKGSLNDSDGKKKTPIETDGVDSTTSGQKKKPVEGALGSSSSLSGAKPAEDVGDKDGYASSTYSADSAITKSRQQNTAPVSKTSSDRGGVAAPLGGAAGGAAGYGAYEHNESSKSKTSDTANSKPKDLSQTDKEEFYTAGVHQGSYEAGQVHAAQEGSLQHQKKSTATAPATGATPSNSAAKQGLVVEVIGIHDRKTASKVAEKASKELAQQGYDLSSGKLVVNADTKEVYKIEEGASQAKANLSSIGAPGVVGAAGAAGVAEGANQPKPTLSTGGDVAGIASVVGAAGAAGVAAGATANKSAGVSSGQSKSATKPYNSETETKNEALSDPTLYHNEHEKAKERLSRAAHDGTLGNVTDDKGGHGAAGVVGAAAAAGAAGVAGTAYNKGHKNNTKKEESTGTRENIPVTVHGNLNPKEAQAIAVGTVNKLKAEPEKLADIEQLNIDVSKGKVYDENGNIVDTISQNSTSQKSAPAVSSAPPANSTSAGSSTGASSKSAPYAGAAIGSGATTTESTGTTNGTSTGTSKGISDADTLNASSGNATESKLPQNDGIEDASNVTMPGTFVW